MVGIELNPSAVEDARANAARNGIPNAEFLAGKAEDLLGKVLADASAPSSPAYSDVVVIVDPPRAGLHPSVLRLLRSCPGTITRLVYVSCHPESMGENAVVLCGPGPGPGRGRGSGPEPQAAKRRRQRQPVEGKEGDDDEGGGAARRKRGAPGASAARRWPSVARWSVS